MKPVQIYTGPFTIWHPQIFSTVYPGVLCKRLQMMEAEKLLKSNRTVNLARQSWVHRRFCVTRVLSQFPAARLHSHDSTYYGVGSFQQRPLCSPGDMISAGDVNHPSHWLAHCVQMGDVVYLVSHVVLQMG